MRKEITTIKNFFVSTPDDRSAQDLFTSLERVEAMTCDQEYKDFSFFYHNIYNEVYDFFDDDYFHLKIYFTKETCRVVCITFYSSKYLVMPDKGVYIIKYY